MRTWINNRPKVEAMMVEAGMTVDAYINTFHELMRKYDEHGLDYVKRHADMYRPGNVFEKLLAIMMREKLKS